MIRRWTWTVLVALTLPLSAQYDYYFPGDQFGQPDLVLRNSSFGLESTFNPIPNFEPILDFTPQNRYRRLARSIGRLDMLLEDGNGNQFVSTCTATLIAEDYILTNFHCIPGEEPNMRLVQAMLRLGYLHPDNEQGEVFNVDITPLENNRSLDFSVLRVEGRPGAKYGFVPLIPRTPRPGEELFMIHHPSGKPQRLTRRNCRLVNSNFAISHDLLRHRCDTEGGSSGSLIFSDNNLGGNFEVVGLHFAGFRERAADAYNSAKPIMSVINSSTILQRLVQRSPDPTPDPTPVTPPGFSIAYGGERLGRLLPSERKIWQFEGNRGDAVTINLISSEFDPVVELLDPSGSQIGSDDDGGGERNARLANVALAAAGTYSIAVRAHGSGESGNYTLRLATATSTVTTAIPENCGFTAETVSYGPLAVGQVVTLGRHRGVNGDENWAGGMDNFVGTVTTVTQLSGVDGEGCPCVRVAIDEGQFAWRIRDMELGGGRPTLQLRDIAYGDVATGSLANVSEAPWQFRSTGADIVTISLTSDEFDPLVQLRDASGNALAEDDDGGEGKNALIQSFTLPGAGLYTIVVKGYDQQAAGEYRLSIDQVVPQLLTHSSSAQGVTLAREFPREFLKGQWDIDRYVTRLTFNNGHWVMAMTPMAEYSNQSYGIRASLGELQTWFTEKAADGFRITDIAHGGGQWAGIVTKGTPFTLQQVETGAALPGDWIRERWNEDYYITDVTYCEGQWIVTMSLGTPWTDQSWATRDSYDGIRDYIKEKWNEDYNLTNIAYGDGKWMAIVTKGTGYHSETFAGRSTVASLREFLDEQWAEGRRLHDIEYDNDSWWVLFVKGGDRP